jgi:hypothetical protein
LHTKHHWDNPYFRAVLVEKKSVTRLARYRESEEVFHYRAHRVFGVLGVFFGA